MSARSERWTIIGRVQGVGYRDWLVDEAVRLGVRGWVRNRADGAVEVLVCGSDAAVSALLAASTRGPRMAAVERIERAAADAEDIPEGFSRRS